MFAVFASASEGINNDAFGESACPDGEFMVIDVDFTDVDGMDEDMPDASNRKGAEVSVCSTRRRASVMPAVIDTATGVGTAVTVVGTAVGVGTPG